MECRLYDEVFENMIAPFADVARYRRPPTAAGLFGFGYDARIRRQLIRRPLNQRVADLSSNTTSQNDADAFILVKKAPWVWANSCAISFTSC